MKNLKSYQVILGVMVYLTVSCLLLIFSAGGWSGVFLLLWSPFFFSLLYILFIILMVIYRKKTNYTFPLKYFILLILTQLLLIMFNVSDCGDGYGGYHFYQHYFLGAVCSSQGVDYTYFPLTGLVTLYVVLLVTFLLNLVTGPWKLQKLRA